MLNISSKELQINDEIEDKKVRVVGWKDKEDRIMSIEDAQNLAIKMNLDLVKIAPSAKPPVCKIMDYGKYCFEINKKERDAKKKQKIVEIKEIRLSLGIDINDVATKTNNAVKFLKVGNKVKVVLKFRGREMVHSQLGVSLLKRFADGCAEYGSIERMPKLDGKNMIMFLIAKR